MKASIRQLYTADESKRIDLATISEFGIDGFTLMELAATKAAEYIIQKESTSKKVLALCGKGNNAGDALVLSRLLSENGFQVDLHFALGMDGLSEDAQRNLNLIQKLIHQGSAIQIIKNPELTKYDIILDGLFGTGLNSAVSGESALLIKAVNQTDSTVYSMDIPSGLDATSGFILGDAIHADVTFMFGTRKTGCYFNDGRAFCGERVFCPLPFPEYLMKQDYPISLLDETVVPEIKKSFRHKYEAGVVYIIGGSPSYTGAAILAAKAAWSTGCGYVSVATPKGLASAYDAHFIEQTRLICGGTSDIEFSINHVSELLETINKKPGVVLLGPGISRKPKVIAFVEDFLKNYEGKIIIDADALFALSTFSSDIINQNCELILTPHSGELKTLHQLENPTTDQLKHLLTTYPNPERTTLMAKGNPGIIATIHECLLTDYDTSIFSRAGFGDVLAGLTAGFLSMGFTPKQALAKALLTGKNRAKKSNSSNFSPSDIYEPIST